MVAAGMALSGPRPRPTLDALVRAGAFGVVREASAASQLSMRALESALPAPDTPCPNDMWDVCASEQDQAICLSASSSEASDLPPLEEATPSSSDDEEDD